MNPAEPSSRSERHKEVDPHDSRSYFEFLADAGMRLAGSLDVPVVGSTLVGLFLAGLADYCALDLAAADGSVTRIAAGSLERFGRDEPAAPEFTVAAPFAPDDVAARSAALPAGEATPVTGSPGEIARILAHDPEGLAAFTALGIERVVGVPLDTAEGRIGVAWLAASNQYALCTLADLRLACDLAARGARALGNARLHAAALEREQAAGRQLVSMIETMQRIEVRIQRLFAANVIGISFTTLDGRINDANDAFLAMIGYTREELRKGAVRWPDITPPEYLARSLQAADELREMAVCTPFEKEYIRKDGARVPVMIGGALVEGSTINCVFFIIDLTEQKRAQHALRESERQNRSLLNAIPDMIFRISTGGVFIDVMTADESTLLMPRREFIGRPLAEVLPPEIAGPVADRIRRVEETGYVEKYEYMMKVGGEDCYFEARLVPNGAEEVMAIVRDITDRKRAEHDLMASERRFRAVLENNWDGIWLLDSDGTILYCSPSTVHILGYAPGEIEGRSCFEMIHPEDLPIVREFYARLLLAPGSRQTFEYRKQHRDGEWRWIEGSCMNLLADPGVSAIVGNFRDITERRRTEEELNARVRQQAVVASFGQRALSGVEATELMDDAVRLIAWVLDIRFCNVLQLLPETGSAEAGSPEPGSHEAGLPESGSHESGSRDAGSFLIRSGVGWRPGVVGSAMMEIGPTSQAGYALLASEPVVVENLAAETRFTDSELLSSHGVVSGINVIIQGKDRPFGVLGAYSSVERRFSIDDIHFLQAMANILGEALVRKDTEGALHASEKHYRALIENSFDATALVAPDGAILYGSPSTTRVLGYDVDEIVGMNIFDQLHPDDLDATAQVYIELLSRPGAMRTMYYRSRHRNGSWRWIEAAATNLIAEDGRHLVICNYHDVTERMEWESRLKAAKEAAEAANNAKDQFLAVLSHELRTPLTPVLASVDALDVESGLPESLQSYVEIIRRNVELEARLIDDLLDLTRIARGKLQLSDEVVDIHSLVHHVEEICRADVRARRLDLRIELGAGRHHVGGDPARLQQVLWNLVQNAVKFTPDEGSIIIRSSNPSPETVRLEVIDTGIGIDPQIMSRIFDAFEQGERTITRRYGGLGLGLAISRMLMNAHGGTLDAASAGENQGSTFTIELKCVPAPGAVAHDMKPAGADTGGRVAPSILLVDDHHDTSLVMKILLERHGYRVTTADTVGSALACAREGSFDLVVSDIGLPDGSGLDLMRELRAMGLVDGIALSGFGMEDDVARSREAGFREHLTKPVSFNRLIQAVEEILKSEI